MEFADWEVEVCQTYFKPKHVTQKLNLLPKPNELPLNSFLINQKKIVITSQISNMLPLSLKIIWKNRTKSIVLTELKFSSYMIMNGMYIYN